MRGLARRLAALELTARRAAPLEPRCGCQIKVIDYRVTIAPLLTDSPERDALIERARTERCPKCHRLRYGGGLVIEPIDRQASGPTVPVIVTRLEGAP